MTETEADKDIRLFKKEILDWVYLDMDNNDTYPCSATTYPFESKEQASEFIHFCIDNCRFQLKQNGRYLHIHIRKYKERQLNLLTSSCEEGYSSNPKCEYCDNKPNHDKIMDLLYSEQPKLKQKPKPKWTKEDEEFDKLFFS
jgi:hypothetical protein